jgi:hypothetical protein
MELPPTTDCSRVGMCTMEMAMTTVKGFFQIQNSKQNERDGYAEEHVVPKLRELLDTFQIEDIDAVQKILTLYNRLILTKYNDGGCVRVDNHTVSLECVYSSILFEPDRFYLIVDGYSIQITKEMAQSDCASLDGGFSI